jgi:tetratricopeptide (TPR) repeat protein
MSDSRIYKEKLQQILASLEKARELDVIAALELQCGDFLYQQGLKLEALQYYYCAYEHYVDLGAKSDASKVLGTIARVHRFLGQFDKALAVFHRLLDGAATQNDPASEAVILMEIGDACRLSERLAEAKGFYLRALALTGGGERRIRGRINHCLARLYLTQYAIAEARLCLRNAQESLTADNHDKADYYRTLLTESRLDLLEDRGPEARARLALSSRLVGDLGESAYLALVELNCALALLVLSEFGSALKSAEKATQMFGECGHWRVSEAFHVLARCYLAQEKIDAAQRAADQAVARYLNLSLYNRINQVEQTMYTAGTSAMLQLTQDELQHEFGNLGI